MRKPRRQPKRTRSYSWVSHVSERIEIEVSIQAHCEASVSFRLILVGVYVIRPYNIHLNPVPEERLNVERTFSYQSGGKSCFSEPFWTWLTSVAVEFLLKHDFRMEAPFLEGVQYFSRAEEATARLLAAQRQDKGSIGEMQIRSDDIATMELMKRVREQVIAWKNRTTVRPTHE